MTPRSFARQRVRVVSPNPPEQKKIRIDLPKGSVFLPGEQVEVIGWVDYPAGEVAIQVSDPSHALILIQNSSIRDQKFKCRFYLSPYAAKGSYTVWVACGDYSETVEFKVVESKEAAQP